MDPASHRIQGKLQFGLLPSVDPLTLWLGRRPRRLLRRLRRRAGRRPRRGRAPLRRWPRPPAARHLLGGLAGAQGGSDPDRGRRPRAPRDAVPPSGPASRSFNDERRIAMTSVTVNGRRYDVDLPDDTPLLWALRDELGLTGTKFGCGMALCGACTVHVDGQPVRACQTPISAVGDQQDHHHRGRRRRPGRPRGAGGLGGPRRAAVRLLSGGPDHVGDRLAQAQPQAHRRRDRRGHERQHLPLRDLLAHPPGHQAGGCWERPDEPARDGRRDRSSDRASPT